MSPSQSRPPASDATGTSSPDPVRRVAFRALEYRADRSVDWVELRFEGSESHGWQVLRDGAPHLSLGPGYRLLETGICGVCSTDLDRHFLPFPLPQVTGHEVLARDDDGRRVVVEINASHAARGREEAADCPHCSLGLDTHCPERLVLGIHDLPGGFGRFILAPSRAVLPVPDSVPDEAAVLIEPFAAALHGVRRSAPRDGDVVAVLGPRRLGMLVVAALAALRRRSGRRYEILALARRAELRALALELGADRAIALGSDGAGPGEAVADLVFDTTASPEGLECALGLARREVHAKSTHGRAAAGLAHATELVVDEITLAPVPPDAETLLAFRSRAAAGRRDGRPIVLDLGRRGVPAAIAEQVRVVEVEDAGAWLRRAGSDCGRGELPQADAALADDAASVDHLLRPRPDDPTPAVRPRGEIWLRGEGEGSPVARAVAGRGLRLSSSRCGRFADALELFSRDPELCARLGRLVTHRLPADRLGEALAVARSADAIKAVVDHRRS